MKPASVLKELSTATEQYIMFLKSFIEFLQESLSPPPPVCFMLLGSEWNQTQNKLGYVTTSGQGHIWQGGYALHVCECSRTAM